MIFLGNFLKQNVVNGRCDYNNKFQNKIKNNNNNKISLSFALLRISDTSHRPLASYFLRKSPENSSLIF